MLCCESGHDIGVVYVCFSEIAAYWTFGHDLCVVCRKRGQGEDSGVVCNQVIIMSNSKSLSPEVRVFMTEEEVLWHELEHGVSQQGSSSEGNPWADVPSARALSQSKAEPSG